MEHEHEVVLPHRRMKQFKSMPNMEAATASISSLGGKKGDIDTFLSSLQSALLKSRPVDPCAFTYEYCKKHTLPGSAGSRRIQHEQVAMLCEAASTDDVAEVKRLLESNVDPCIGDYDRRTALHLAVEEGHIECVRLLLDYKADVNCTDRWGHTPLRGGLASLALHRTNSGVIDLLIDRSFDQMQLPDMNEAAQAIADPEAAARTIGKTVEDARAYINIRKTDVNRLGEQAENLGTKHLSDLEDRVKATTQKLLRYTEALQPPSEDAKIGNLCAAAAAGRRDEVWALLQSRVDVDKGDYDDRCALHLASEEGHLDVVKMLVEQGADVNVMDRWGTTPLKGSETNSHFHIADFLRDHGAVGGRAESELADISTLVMQATTWWTQKLCKFAGLPRQQEAVPMTKLVELLQQQYGLDPSHHQLLRRDLIALARPSTDAGSPSVSSNGQPLRREAWQPSEEDCGVDSRSSLFSSEDLVHKQDYLDFIVSSLPGCDGEIPQSCPSLSTLSQATKCSPQKISILAQVVLNKLAIGNWESFQRIIQNIYEEVLADETLSHGAGAGHNADYIPELRDAPSDRLAIAVCTANGQMCSFGECDEFFSVQSTGKGFAYTLAMQQHTRQFNSTYEGPEGPNYVHRYVGQEPSGRAFNAFDMTQPDAAGIQHPFNPVTNAGAIVTCSMIDEHCSLPLVPGDGQSERMEARMHAYKAFLSDLSGGMAVGDCMEVFESERSEAFNNYALANYMRARNTFPPHISSHDHLRDAVDFYIRVCSAKVNTKMLARIAGSYATFGTSPLTGRSIICPTLAKQTLQILNSCGMYDFSGEWACTVGMPAKSGVSGNIFIVVPGMLGLCVWSPRLDQNGNSVRGIRMAQLFKKHVSCSLLDLLQRAVWN